MEEIEYIIHREGGKLWAQPCESAGSPDWDLPTVIGGVWATSPERAVQVWLSVWTAVDAELAGNHSEL